MSVEHVKVGDFVRLIDGEEDWMDMTPGKIYEVFKISDNAFLINDDAGDARWMNKEWDEFELASTLSPKDTVRLKSGEPFTTGSYTALVDSVTEDKVILKHGSWLPVEAVEKVEAWLPEGDGWIEYSGGGNPVPGAKVEWLLKRERRDRKFFPAASASDGLLWGEHIVAYRVVESAPVPAAEPAAETKPKFKVGDRVRALRESCCVDCTGIEGTIRRIDGDGDFLVDFDNDGHWWQEPGDLELVDPPTASVVNLTLSVDTSYLQADLADQFQRIADALRAA